MHPASSSALLSGESTRRKEQVVSKPRSGKLNALKNLGVSFPYETLILAPAVEPLEDHPLDGNNEHVRAPGIIIYGKVIQVSLHYRFHF
jgi:hypothetical protein